MGSALGFTREVTLNCVVMWGDSTEIASSCMHEDSQAETTSSSKASWGMVALAAPGHGNASGEGWSPLMAHKESVPAAGAAVSSRQGTREGKAWEVTATWQARGRGA